MYLKRQSHQSVISGYAETTSSSSHRCDVDPGVGHRVVALSRGKIVGPVVPVNSTVDGVYCDH
jgi:hypothetical protein